MTAAEERFLSTEEVAERLQVDEQTVRRWIKSGKLEAVKPGREWRIPPSAFEALLESYSSPKVQAPLSPEDAQRRSVPEALYSYMGLRAKSLEAELKDENSPNFKNATAATNWIAGVQREAKDWADWAAENWSVLMPPGGSFFDKNTWLDALNIMGHLMTFHAIARKAEQRIAAMDDRPDDLSQRRLERARHEARESERRLQEIQTASG